MALYARVSSEQQAQQETVESQVAALKQRIKTDGHLVSPHDEYIDEGFSGATLLRPALERLRDRVAEGALEILYVHSPDRLARKYAYQVLLLDEFRKHGVATIFLQGPSGHTAEDELLVQVQGMIAEYERAKILERSRRGKLYRARQGSINVLGGAPYGYLYVKKTDQTPASYRVLLPQAKVVRQIFRSLAHEQKSIGQISRDLNTAQVETPAGARQWNRSTIRNIAMNPAYIGKAAFGKTESVESNKTLRPRRGSKGISKHHTTQRPRPEAQWISIDVPSIVSREVFETAQEQIARNRKLSERNGRCRHLLQGLTVCRLCGYSFCGASTNRSPAKGGAVYTYYRCAGSEGPRFAGGAVCNNRPVRAQPLEEHVWNAVTDVMLNPSRIFEEWSRRQKHHGAPAELQERRDEAMRTLATHERGLQRLVDAYEIGAVDLNELKTRSDAVRARIQRARREADDADQALQKSGQLRLVIARVDDFANRVRERLNELSWHERRQIIRMLVESVEIDESGATIVFRLPTINTDPIATSPTSGADSEKTATPQSYGLRTGSNAHLPLERNA